MSVLSPRLSTQVVEDSEASASKAPAPPLLVQPTTTVHFAVLPRNVPEPLSPVLDPIAANTVIPAVPKAEGSNEVIHPFIGSHPLTTWLTFYSHLTLRQAEVDVERRPRYIPPPLAGPRITGGG